MIFLMRLCALALACVAALGGFGSFMPDEKGHRPVELLPIFLVMAGAAVFLFLRANEKAAREARAAMNRRLLLLGQATGTLTVAMVVAELSLGSEEANEALAHLSRDGLAEMDANVEGETFYKVQKLPPKQHGKH